jgi:hypothetical protein
MANSDFWRNLGERFVKLQRSGTLRQNDSNAYFHSTLQTLISQGTSAIAASDTTPSHPFWFWLGELKNAGLVLHAPSNTPITEPDPAWQIEADTLEGICEASATFCTRLESRALQQESREQHLLTSSNPRVVESDPAKQPVYVQRQIDPRDNSLIRDKFRIALRETRKNIAKRESEIRFANRRNLNRTSVESQVVRMWTEEIEAHIEDCYEIFCHYWNLLGHERTAAFVRYSLALLQSKISRLASTAAHEAKMAHRRQGGLGPNTAEDYKKAGDSIKSHWQEKLGIEARELDVAASTRAKKKRASVVASRRKTSSVPAAKGLQAETLQGSPDVSAGESNPLKRRPGRKPRRSNAFVVFAGNLWKNAVRQNKGQVSAAQLQEIATTLDTAGHLPPSAYLEGKIVEELKTYNSRNSNSKRGSLKTWSQIVSCDDKDFLRAMRRLLSRCAEQIDDRRLSGN